MPNDPFSSLNGRGYCNKRRRADTDVNKQVQFTAGCMRGSPAESVKCNEVDFRHEGRSLEKKQPPDEKHFLEPPQISFPQR